MIASSVTTQTSTPAPKGQRLDLKKNSNKEGFSSLLGFENAESTKPVETPVAPVAKNLKTPISDQIVGNDSQISEDSEVDSLGQRSAMQKFIFKMESELGVKPSKILEAFADLDPEELQKSPRETMNLVIENLGLSPQQVPVAKQYFQELLDQTEGQELQSVVKSGDRRLTLEVLSQKELRQKALEKSLEKMNQNFFAQPIYKHPAMASANAQNIPNAKAMNQDLIQNQNANPINNSEMISQEGVGNSESIDTSLEESDQNNELAGINGMGLSEESAGASSSSSSSSPSAMSASFGGMSSPLKSSMGAKAISAESVQTPAPISAKKLGSLQEQNVTSPLSSTIENNMAATQSGTPSDVAIASRLNAPVSTQGLGIADQSEEPTELETYDLSALGLEEGSVDPTSQFNSDLVGPKKLQARSEDLNFAQIQQELAAIKNGKSSSPAQNMSASMQNSSSIGMSGAGLNEKKEQDSDSQENLQQQDTSLKPDGTSQKLNVNSKNPEFVMANRPTESQHAQNVKAISDQADLMVKKGGGEIKVRLQPEGLGEILLKVRTKGANVHLEMVAENSEAKRLIEGGLSDLKANLAHHKLSVDNVKVEVASQIQTQLENQQKEQERQFSQQFMQDFSRKNQEWRQGFYDIPGARGQPSQIDEGQAEKIRTLSARQNSEKSTRRLNLVA